MTIEHLELVLGHGASVDDSAPDRPGASPYDAGKAQSRCLLGTPEDILRCDPSGHYEDMDRATKAIYRAQVYQLSRWCQADRAAIAEEAVKLALEGAGAETRDRHVGFYLLGKGRSALEQRLRARVPIAVQIARFAHDHARLLHFGVVASCAFCMIAVCMLVAHHTGPTAGLSFAVAATLTLLGFLAFVPIAEGLVRESSDALLPRGVLPKMRTIPPDVKALIVVPCLLTSTHRLEQLCRKLELLCSQCTPGRFVFALLSDFQDSTERETSEDRSLLRCAVDEIDRLNAIHGCSAESPTFLILHRGREWNDADACWQGKERKRGKLSALFQFLNGLEPFPFVATAGSSDVLQGVQYVISLDCDTELTASAADSMLGAALHPLNRARVTVKDGRRHAQGYGILQPCMCSTAIPRNASIYERWQFGDLGTEKKVQNQHDLSQEWFAESGFFGKGLYDVKAFCDSDIHRLPECLILSHDIVEGALSRSGALVDVALAERVPGTYLAGAFRWHRWMRGDWQNLLWLIADGSKASSFRTAIDSERYRAVASAVICNVIRNNTAFSNLLLIFVGSLVFPHAWSWAASVIAMMALPIVASTSKAALQSRAHAGTTAQWVAACSALVAASARRFIFGMSTWYFDAAMTVDAQIRATWRVCVSGQSILQWTESALVAEENAFTYWRSMGPMLLLSLCILGIAVAFGMHVVVACLLALLWVVSPIVAWRVSVPHVAPECSRSAAYDHAAQPSSDDA